VSTPRLGSRTLRPSVARALARATLGLSAVALGACGAHAGPGATGTSSASSHSSERAALVSYLRQVDPIRLAVNQLLTGADPILEAYTKHTISPVKASARMGELESKFAGYTVDIAAVKPAMPALRALHAEYAHTYILEDSYLSALTAGLAQRQLGDLPDTQAVQRAAIIQWRTGLEVLAREAHATLPVDLQQAGRGELRPFPGTS
jgi:hypothetical protein